MFDVITLGSATIDVFANTLAETITIHTKEREEKLVAYPLGSKIVVKDIDFLTGGGGTNSAVTFSRFGLNTAFVGKIGRGVNGYKVFEMLKKENISFIGTVDDSEKDTTGFSIVLDSIERDRTILTYKGCNDSLLFEELNLEKLKARWFYSSSLIEESYKTLIKVFQHAKKIGAKTAFNPSNYQTQKGLSFMIPVLKNTDILTLNYEEANLLLGKNNAPVEELLKGISDNGPKFVVVTDGHKGLYAYNREEGMMYILTPKKNIKVVETTGAGDAFGSGFVASLVLGNSFEDSLRIGLLNAESVIQKVGAKAGILYKKDIDRILRIEPHLLVKKNI